jgi:hypothetical protein
VKNKEAKIELIKDYGPICMAGDKPTVTNYLTIHHLIPVRNGGRTILTNLALLSRLSHDKFNVIEIYKPRTAKEINDELRHYKAYRDELIRVQLYNYMNDLIHNLGYTVEDNGKLYVLKSCRK